MKPLIVGGSRGIGRAAVMELSRRGIRSAFAYVSDDEAAAAVVAETAAVGPKPVVLKGDVATSYYGHLGPAKAALEASVRYLGAELAPRNVRVNPISPCLVDEDAHFRGDADQAKQFLEPVAKRTPMGRLVTPRELAGTLLALASPDFQFMTGQTLVVDGGYSLLA